MIISKERNYSMGLLTEELGEDKVVLPWEVLFKHQKS